MTAKKLLPFIVILALLAGLAFLRKSGDAPPSLVEQAGLEPLVPEGIEAGDLAKIELYAAAKPEEKVVLEKDGTAWKIASSYNAPVAEDAIKEYLDTLVGLKGEARALADSDEKLERFELKDDQAFRLLAYEKKDGEAAIDLLIGKSDGHGGVFLRKAGDSQVYSEAANPREDAGVWSSDLTTAPTVDKWLDKDILGLEQDKFTKVALTMPDKAFTFEKQAKPVETPETPESPEGEATPAPTPPVEYEWKLTEGGIGGEFKQTALNNILLKAATLKATGVADPEKAADWGLEAPAYRCTVTQDGGEEVAIEGGRPDLTGSGYVRIAGENDLIYEVSSYEFGQLFPKGRDLFTLPDWGVEEGDLTRVVIDQPEGRVVLSKVGEDWTVSRPELALEVQKTAISTLVSGLASWTPEDYADANADTGEFARTISVTVGDTTRTVQVAGDAKCIDGVYAKIEGNDTNLVMRRTDVEKLFLKPRDVYRMKLFDLTESQVQELEVSHGGSVLTLARKGEGWSKAVGGAGPEDPVTVSDADTSAADDLAYDLTELEASDIHVGSETSIENPFATLSVKSTEGESFLLQVGPEQDGKHTLSMGSQGTLLEIDKAEIEGFLAAATELTAPPAEVAPAEPAESSESPEAAAGATPSPEAAAGATPSPEAAAGATQSPEAAADPTPAPEAEVSSETPETETPAEVVVAPTQP